MNKRIALVIAVVTLGFTLVLAACDGDDSFSQGPGGEPDAAQGNDATLADAGDAGSADAGDSALLNCPDAGTSAPATLECTGLYSDFASRTIAPGVVSYAPAVPFWTDGATGKRWVYLPPGTTIDDTDANEWTFPTGTRFWMELSFGGAPIETRFFEKISATQWVYTTYLWDADASAAPQFAGGDLANVITSDAGTTYHVPSSTECLECHRGRTDRILGFEAIGLGTAGAQGLTLFELASQGLLSPVPAQTSLTIADDGTGLAAVPLGWLHANCGIACHNRNSNALANGTGEFFRIDPAWIAAGQSATTYDSMTTTLNVPAVSSAWIGQLRIDPGYPSQSLVVNLAGNRTPNFEDQMPPIVTKVVPTANVAVLASWVAAMPHPLPDGGTDAGEDAGTPVVTGMEIVTSNGVPLAAVPGTALPLEVVFTMSDGTTQPLPSNVPITWTSPGTITTQDPNNPGPGSVLPDAGSLPTAFYAANPFRPDRTDYTGLLFVLSQGSSDDAGVTVSAQLDNGVTISTVVPVGPAPAGDPDAGQALFQNVLRCSRCHGTTGDGSPPATLEDGGAALDDAGDPLYSLGGSLYPYPAPGLNNTSPGGSPNLGADPQWSAPLLGMAAQGDFDNFGVALRFPMPDWSKGKNAQNQPLTAQDFANIYSWLVTQTQ